MSRRSIADEAENADLLRGEQKGTEVGGLAQSQFTPVAPPAVIARPPNQTRGRECVSIRWVRYTAQQILPIQTTVRGVAACNRGLEALGL